MRKDPIKCDGHILDEIAKIRDNLYDALPSGEIYTFDLLKIITAHIQDLDIIHDYYSRIKFDLEKSNKEQKRI